MKIYRNLTIIGTSHISPESVKTVEALILSKRPAIVAIELDKARFDALIGGENRGASFGDIKKIGLKGYVFAKFAGWVEKKLGNKVGISPGDEMISASRAAEKVKAKIALIDQPIEKTLRGFSLRITWKEKFRFVWDLLTGWFRKDMRMRIDLKKVPEEEVIEKMVDIVRRRYPNVYDVLIAQRNQVMAKHLNKLMQRYDTIIAVVGAGHEKEIINIIEVNNAV